MVTDPYGLMVGWKLSTLKADVVTVSHQHQDHNNVLGVKSNSDQPKPFLIDQAGEYEVGGITVFGHPTWHDQQQGAARGINLIFSIYLDGVHVLHLGDLGHQLSESQIEEIGDIDVLLVPVGGAITLDPQGAMEVIAALEPGVVIPMHYRTPSHDQKIFGELVDLADFVQKYGKTASPQEKLVISARTSEEEAETQLVLLEPKIA